MTRRRHAPDVPRDFAGRPTKAHKRAVVRAHPGFLYVTCPTPGTEKYVFTGTDSTVVKTGLDAAYRFAMSELSN